MTRVTPPWLPSCGQAFDHGSGGCGRTPRHQANESGCLLDEHAHAVRDPSDTARLVMVPARSADRGAMSKGSNRIIVNHSEPVSEFPEAKLLQLFDVSLTCAASARPPERLGQSQPTICIWLGRLRQRVGDPLFVRTQAA